jgi:hypothetical protein
MAQFITTSHGGEKMIFNNFIYHKSRKGANGQIYWNCIYKTTATKCPGYAFTDAERNATMTKEHNHASSPTQVEVARIKNGLRHAATTSDMAPRALLNNRLAGISDQAKVRSVSKMGFEKNNELK